MGGKRKHHPLLTVILKIFLCSPAAGSEHSLTHRPAFVAEPMTTTVLRTILSSETHPHRKKIIKKLTMAGLNAFGQKAAQSSKETQDEKSRVLSMLFALPRTFSAKFVPFPSAFGASRCWSRLRQMKGFKRA